MREVVQRAGGVNYALVQLCNPNSVVLRTGGKCGDEQLIAGQVGTSSKSYLSIRLYKLLSGLIISKFKKIRSYYVGPTAEALLDSGVRLSATPRSPKVYDLSRL